MPQMGESLAEGTIVRWLKQPRRSRRARRAAVRDLDRQGRHRRAGAGRRRAAGDSRRRRRDGRRSAPRRGDRDDGAVRPADAAARRRRVHAPPRQPTRPRKPGGHFKSTHAPQLVSFRRDGRLRPAAHRTGTADGTAAARPARSLVLAGACSTTRSARAAARAADVAAGVGTRRADDQARRRSGSSRRSAGRRRRRPERCRPRSAATPAGAALRNSSTGPPSRIGVEPMSPVRKRIARHMRWSVRISPHASAFSANADMSAGRARDGASATRFARAHGCAADLHGARGRGAGARAARVPGPQQLGRRRQHRLQAARSISASRWRSPTRDELIVPVVRRADGLALVGLARAIAGPRDAGARRGGCGPKTCRAARSR